MIRFNHRPSRGHGIPGTAGFTLVELLVVIAIIAVLVSILMPAVGRARRGALGVVCRSNLRNIGQAMYGYAGDYDGRFPFWGEPENWGWPPGGVTTTAGRNSAGAQWDVQITPYLGIPWEWGSVSPPPELGLRPTLFYCPAGKPFHPNPAYVTTYVRSQSYNYNIAVGNNVNNSRSLELLEDPQNTMLVVDAHRQDAYTGFECLAATYIGRQSHGYIYVGAGASFARNACYHRHDEAIHVLFAGAHVEARPRSPGTYYGLDVFPAGVRFGNGYPLFSWP